MAVSAWLTDAFTRHQVFVQRLASGEERKFVPFLREMDRELRDRLSGAADLTEFSRARLERLLKGVDDMLAGVFDSYTKAMLEDVQTFGEHEAGFSARALTSSVANFEAVIPTVTQVRAAVLARPLQVRGPGGGNLLKPWIKDWTAAERKVVTGVIRRGVFEGQTNGQLITALRGTKARNYADGALEITARHARAVVRTAVQHVSTAAREETFEANADLVERVQWIATLDKRTCPRCGALDGLIFLRGKGPRSPLHPVCRCTLGPVLSAEFEILNKGATRASKGAEGGAQVDASESYYEWLQRQPAAFQDEAIGPARAKLLRDGGLSSKRFAAMQLDKQFAPLTLEEMMKLEPLAFVRAGVNP